MVQPLRVLGLAALFTFWVCGPAPTQQAGGGSDRPNAPAFSGTVFSSLDGWLPAAGVTVDLYRITEDSSDAFSWGLAVSVTADENGEFIIGSLEPGYYSLLASDGVSCVFGGYRYLADTATVDLDTLVLDRLYDIDGVLQDAAGQPVSGVDLRLVGTPYYCRIDTGVYGTFLFSGVAAGNYKMEIRRWAKLVTAGADSAGNYISLDGVVSLSATDTAYASTYGDLPLPGSDSVTVSSGSVEVVGDQYIINYTIQ